MGAYRCLQLYFKSKSDSEIIEEYVKCCSLLDYSYNVPFNDKYKEFIDEYGEELLIFINEI